MKYKVVVILILLSSFVLAACADSPERAAREWFDAMLNLDGNTILERTCLAQRAYIQEIGLWNSAIALLPQMFGLNMESQGDVSGLEFSTIDINPNETVASVRVSGEIRMAVLALAQSYPVDETWLMVKEDGGWRWCGIP